MIHWSLVTKIKIVRNSRPKIPQWVKQMNKHEHCSKNSCIKYYWLEDYKKYPMLTTDLIRKKKEWTSEKIPFAKALLDITWGNICLDTTDTTLYLDQLLEANHCKTCGITSNFLFYHCKPRHHGKDFVVLVLFTLLRE